MIDLLFLFCIYSFLGWLIEVAYFFVKTKKFCKRGILNGPYCVLYGTSMSVCTVILKYVDGLLYQYLICALICTTFELISAIIIDKALKQKMWDYSNMKYNFKGYICLKFSIIWGFLSLFSIYFINPILLQSNDASFAITKFISSIGIISFITLDSLTFVTE